MIYDILILAIFGCIVLIVVLIVGFLFLRDKLSQKNVSWLHAKYSVVPYRDNFKYNFNGQIISYDEHFVICRKIPFFFSTTYVDCDHKEYVYFRDHEYHATYFKNKLEAIKKLNDILENPDNYKLG